MGSLSDFELLICVFLVLNVVEARSLSIFKKQTENVILIFKCYSSEELITLNTLLEVVPTWYRWGPG